MPNRETSAGSGLIIERRHLVWVTDKKLRCDVACPSEDHHLDEYRAMDVNPNRTPP